MTNSELPQDRVTAYLDAVDVHDRRAGSGWRYGDTIHSFNDLELTRQDIRDVLNELAEYQRLLIEIDTVLDEYEGAALIDRVREIMGNRVRLSND